jgi:hypothetical protein
VAGPPAAPSQRRDHLVEVHFVAVVEQEHKSLE